MGGEEGRQDGGQEGLALNTIPDSRQELVSDEGLALCIETIPDSSLEFVFAVLLHFALQEARAMWQVLTSVPSHHTSFQAGAMNQLWLDAPNMVGVIFCFTCRSLARKPNTPSFYFSGLAHGHQTTNFMELSRGLESPDSLRCQPYLHGL